MLDKMVHAIFDLWISDTRQNKPFEISQYSIDLQVFTDHFRKLFGSHDVLLPWPTRLREYAKMDMARNKIVRIFWKEGVSNPPLFLCTLVKFPHAGVRAQRPRHWRGFDNMDIRIYVSSKFLSDLVCREHLYERNGCKNGIWCTLLHCSVWYFSFPALF